MIRVLHVSQPTIDGVAEAVATTASFQVGAGWSVFIACPSDGILSDRSYDAGAGHVPWPSTRQPNVGLVQECLALAHIVDSIRPDVVHLHSAKAGLVGRLVIRGAIPTLYEPNGWSFLAGSRTVRRAALGWERLAARWADRIVCVSNGEKMLAVNGQIDGRLTVVPNGIDPSRWSEKDVGDRSAARQRLGLNGGPLVVCPGRLCPQKGQDVLLAAWPTVARGHSSAVLALVGDGPDREAIGEVARRLERVRVVGRSKVMHDWYAAADVVTLPSRWEGLSFAMLEAAATGTSLVVTDVPGAAEAIPSGAGAIVPRDDPTALAEAIGLRVGDLAKAHEEGHVAAAHCRSTLTLEGRWKKLRAVYSEAMVHSAWRPDESGGKVA